MVQLLKWKFFPDLRWKPIFSQQFCEQLNQFVSYTVVKLTRYSIISALFDFIKLIYKIKFVLYIYIYIIKLSYFLLI